MYSFPADGAVEKFHPFAEFTCGSTPGTGFQMLQNLAISMLAFEEPVSSEPHEPSKRRGIKLAVTLSHFRIRSNAIYPHLSEWLHPETWSLVNELLARLLKGITCFAAWATNQNAKSP